MSYREPSHDDEGLRALFADLARDDARRAPRFDPTRTLRERRNRRLTWLAAGVAVAAGIALFIGAQLAEPSPRVRLVLPGIVEPEPLAFLLRRPSTVGETP